MRKLRKRKKKKEKDNSEGQKSEAGFAGLIVRYEESDVPPGSFRVESVSLLFFSACRGYTHSSACGLISLPSKPAMMSSCILLMLPFLLVLFCLPFSILVFLVIILEPLG